MDYKDFKFWFKYKCTDTWSIIDKASNSIIGDISKFGTIKFSSSDTSIFDLNIDGISEEWKSYQLRPEFCVGQVIDLSNKSSDVIKSNFELLLKGIMLCRSYRANQDPDAHIEYINKVIDWLRSTDFYDSPASTIYHESFKHGLLYHTVSVYNNVIELYQIPKFFEKVEIDSASLCAISHDWCKIGLYESYKRNVKNEDTGKWEQKDSYRRKSFPHPLGHGVASMYMTMKMFKLTEAEALAIRWHMSMFNVSSNEINEYQQACEDFPLVHLIQFADQLAITNY